jgi:hypothetical protein
MVTMTPLLVANKETEKFGYIKFMKFRADTLVTTNGNHGKWQWQMANNNYVRVSMTNSCKPNGGNELYASLIYQ